MIDQTTLIVIVAAVGSVCFILGACFGLFLAHDRSTSRVALRMGDDLEIEAGSMREVARLLVMIEPPKVEIIDGGPTGRPTLPFDYDHG